MDWSSIRASGFFRHSNLVIRHCSQRSVFVCAIFVPLVLRSASLRFTFPMLIRYSAFEANLTRRKFHANYFVFGADPCLIELAVKSLTRAVQEANEGQVEPVTVDLDDTSVEEFVNTAQSLSMFAPRQLLVVKGVMKLREHQGKRLVQYFSNPNPQTIALFLAGDLDRDQRKKKIFDILSSGTEVLELAPLEAREVAAWLQHQAKARDCTLEPDAIRFLLDLQ